MECEIKFVNQTQKYDFYICVFDKFSTGTMDIEKAKKLKEWLSEKERVTVKELTKAFAYSGISLYYANPLKQIF